VLVDDDLGLVVHHLGDGVSALGVCGDGKRSEAAYELGLGVENEPLVLDDGDASEDTDGDSIKRREGGSHEASTFGGLLIALDGGGGVE